MSFSKAAGKNGDLAGMQLPGIGVEKYYYSLRLKLGVSSYQPLVVGVKSG
jgi:hypothetical protein